MKLWNRFWIKPEELPVHEWCQRGPRRKAAFVLQGQRASGELSQLNCRCPTYGPTACAGLFSSLNVDLNQRGCQLCPHQKEKTKVYLISAENCNSGSAGLASHIQAPPNGQGRRLLWGGEGRQEAAGNRTHCFPSTGSSSGKVGPWLHFLPGSAMSQDARAPYSGLRTPFCWGFCLLAFWNRHRGL